VRFFGPCGAAGPPLTPAPSPFPEARFHGILTRMPLDDFDPDAPAEGEGIYGLPHQPEEAATILVPVPWDATASYGSGASAGPEAILRASRQVDLFDTETGRPYAAGISMLPIPEQIRQWNDQARELARLGRTAEVDRYGEKVRDYVRETAGGWHDRGKLVGLVGGDHSCPLGWIEFLAARRPGFGILHLDAHADLRQAYEGFRYSHASIFFNVITGSAGVERLVQIGLRDLGSREAEMMHGSGGRIVSFFESGLRRRQQEGEPWSALLREVLEPLPEEVYLSFDIDGLDPALCPHTGTPVPGGWSFAEITALLRALAESGRSVLGFDLCEVAPDPGGGSEWDGNVGARLLYKMIGFARMNRRE
jgi:agmatinase